MYHVIKSLINAIHIKAFESKTLTLIFSHINVLPQRMTKHTTQQATFGLQDGSKQDKAIKMLESLLCGGSIVTTGAIYINATAAMISCLRSLPLHEGTNEALIGTGPPWMVRAARLLVSLLPSSVQLVRIAAAGGLGLLSSLGVTEDAHGLQVSLITYHFVQF